MNSADIDEAEFIRAWNEPGANNVSIGFRFGIHRETARKLGLQLGLPKHDKASVPGITARRPIPETLAAHVAARWSLRQLSEHYGTTRQQVKVWADRAGLTLVPGKPGFAPRDEGGDVTPGLFDHSAPKVHRSAFDDLPFSAQAYATALRALAARRVESFEDA